MPRVTIYRPLSVQLSQFGARRTPPDAIAAHPLLRRFDDDTLFFDVFSVSRHRVACIGPPIDTCSPAIEVAAARRHTRTYRHRIRQQFSTRTVVSGSAAGERAAIWLEANGVQQFVAVNADASHLLAGRRVLVTVSKDNPLAWIQDWAEFYVREHSADALLIYDNGSVGYTPDDIGAALAPIDGLTEVVIVPWPFPYGVGGPVPGEHALDNFCQTVALDHARRCLCRLSRSVLNVDVDELLVADGPSIFERVERSRQAVLLFHGIWTEAPAVSGPPARQAVRHRDCVFAWREQLEALAEGRLAPLCRTKWVCVPSRCSGQVEWGVHEVYAATRWARLTRRSWLGVEPALAYRHCRQINTGWKVDRWRSSDDFAERCVFDAAMSAAIVDLPGGPRHDQTPVE